MSQYKAQMWGRKKGIHIFYIPEINYCKRQQMQFGWFPEGNQTTTNSKTLASDSMTVCHCLRKQKTKWIQISSYNVQILSKQKWECFK